MSFEKKRLGLIVNPIAGMGGTVGLKGSDGKETLEKAIQLGAKPVSPTRAKQALEVIKRIKEQIEIITYPNDMGENEVLQSGFIPKIIGSTRSHQTTPEDTKKAAQEMLNLKVDLILFSGGDGTARDIHDAIGMVLPVIGIPAGVKMHSAVYATNPRNAGELAILYLQGALKTLKEVEVMDIDEEAFRDERLTARLYGYLKVPHQVGLIQDLKAGTPRSEEVATKNAAEGVIRDMEDDCMYIIGPGTTTRAIMERLRLKNTLLGVDAIFNKNLLGSDLNENQIKEIMKNKLTKIIVTVIGGQGYIFGRGNQQISHMILKQVGKKNIIIVSTQNKIASLHGRPLLIDTGDDETNQILRGFYKVTVGYDRQIIYKAT